MNQSAVNFKLEKRSVNSKPLFNEIHAFIEEGINSNSVVWSNDIHRLSFVEVLNDYLEQFHEQGQIDQWNAFCDLRNNTVSAMDKGEYVIEVTYRQTTCLNTTRLIYRVQDLLLKNLKELLDFELTP